MRHAVFLERASESGGAPGPASAAFLALRMVDLLALEAPATGEDAFETARGAVAALVAELEPSSEAFCLSDLTGAARAAPADRFRAELIRALRVYAINRRDAERHDEAVDVIETAARLVPSQAGMIGDLGRHLLLAGRLDELAARCEEWVRDASVYVRREGRYLRAEVALARGGAAEAEREFRDLVERREGVDDDPVSRAARHAVPRALLARGLVAEAVVAAWKVEAGAPGDALAVVAEGLERLGHLDAAADAVGSAALGHPQAAVRWDALAALVRLEARQGDRMTFERWVQVGRECHNTGLPAPGHEVGFWLEAARGLAELGEPKAAARAIGMAGEVVAAVPGEEARFRVRRVAAAIAEGAPADYGPPVGVPAGLEGAVAEVVAGVRVYGPAREWADLARRNR